MRGRDRVRGALATHVADGLLLDVELGRDCAVRIGDVILQGESGDVLGNGLYGGGNPARRAALLAGLGEETPALTLDRQCCSGLDAIALGARLIESGSADCVLAGGVESYSRAPERHAVDAAGAVSSTPYVRPPFTPWPDRDPEMTDAAAALAVHLGISANRQADWAVESHVRALAADRAGALFQELVEMPGAVRDAYMRALTPRTCMRSRRLAGAEGFEVRAATAAVSADAAAVVCLGAGTISGWANALPARLQGRAA